MAMKIRRNASFRVFAGVVVAALAMCISTASQGQAARGPVDPGVRGGAPGAGTALEGLTADETAFFQNGLAKFLDIESVTGGENNGIGPRFNSNQCLSCHSQPSVGGSSPATNPLIIIATLDGARNVVPWFITQNGPIREARFKRNPNGTNDGGVHNLFVITGRKDAAGCNIAQPRFLPAGNPLTGKGGNPNIVFRIPTPVFGAGLIEGIPDAAILANMKAQAHLKKPLGILGHPNAHLSGNANRSANDGTITRFGWKAQNKSLLLFAGEAYNVEMGVTNQLFPQERDETPTCQFTTGPNTVTNTTGATPQETISAIEKFAFFMRFLAPPAPSPDTPGGAASIATGKTLFSQIGCALCHTPTLYTGNSTVAALGNQTVNLYSDLLVHDMGIGLADGVSQGRAGPREFRSAPLWGLGKRVFFLHDGRTSNLIEAIEAHQSGNVFFGTASEANLVTSLYNGMLEGQKQDLLNFLRSL